MGIKYPPLYGNNEIAHAKQALEAVKASKAAIAEGNKDKALSAIDYAVECNSALLNILKEEEK